ncbi:hypothetical protein ACH5RR_023159 [Cinchona calisaya]|uniref:Uncharacterized protein n=1 Tax=Cinchona calisaya TaxID=153742 RepID=A0ABD2ZDR7_9GENT
MEIYLKEVEELEEEEQTEEVAQVVNTLPGQQGSTSEGFIDGKSDHHNSSLPNCASLSASSSSLVPSLDQASKRKVPIPLESLSKKQAGNLLLPF